MEMATLLCRTPIEYYHIYDNDDKDVICALRDHVKNIEWLGHACMMRFGD